VFQVGDIRESTGIPGYVEKFQSLVAKQFVDSWKERTESFAKPFTPEQLLKKIKKALDNHRVDS
jgi:hypothetical protein